MALSHSASAHLERRFIQDIKVKDIADEAGATPAMINYYFGGKDGLFASLLEEALALVCRNVQAAARAHSDPVDLIMAILGILDEHFTRTRYLFNLTAGDLTQQHSQIHEAYRTRCASSVHRQITHAIESLFEGMPKAHKRAEVAAYSICSAGAMPFFMQNYFAYFFPMGADPEQREYCWRTLAEMIVGSARMETTTTARSRH